jgi:hypothetical protein
MSTTESIQIKWDSSLYDNKHDFVFKHFSPRGWYLTNHKKETIQTIT